MIVLPAPASSASRNRTRGSFRRWSYTASSWCGSGSTRETDNPKNGSNSHAMASACASSPSLSRLLSPSYRNPLSSTFSSARSAVPIDTFRNRSDRVPTRPSVQSFGLVCAIVSTRIGSLNSAPVRIWPLARVGGSGIADGCPLRDPAALFTSWRGPGSAYCPSDPSPCASARPVLYRDAFGWWDPFRPAAKPQTGWPGGRRVRLYCRPCSLAHVL